MIGLLIRTSAGLHFDRLLPQNAALQFSCRDIWAYLRVVDAAPIQPVEDAPAGEASATPPAVDRALLDELWHECGAGSWGLERKDFDRILLVVATTQKLGMVSGVAAQMQEHSGFFRNLKLDDLVLAKACAAGNERAWEHFMAIYGQPLTRAAIAISGNETVGRDLADAFYAELYGLNTRDGERRCPLDSYRGHGSLLGWLRTTLAQRFVDHYRRTFREQPLIEQVHDVVVSHSVPEPELPVLATLRHAIHAALRDQSAEEQFLFAAYYVDDKTLAEIGRVLHVHEATISRRLKRATDEVRKRVMRNLEKHGMSRRAAEEALGTDPRDLNLKMDLRKLLQSSEPAPFHDQAAWDQAGVKPAPQNETLSTTLLSDTRESLSDKAKTTG